ncbi:MAG TPA: OmpA family protein [Stellaceae bacterium]|jgi:outer membrane protein OmpA-like peptidoglycan-associated protein|nr:OmpA family protein [Stellaceae bacterium]
MRYRYLLGALVGIAAALSWADAQAQLLGPGAWYIGGEGGWTSLNNAHVSAAGLGGTVNFNGGWNAGARLGYMVGPWRFEGEYRHQENGVNGFAGVSASGTVTADALMANAIYDFSLSSSFSPHIGAGIGMADLTASSRVPGIGTTLSNSSDWEFAYQAIAGLRYTLNPNWALDVDYRYLGTADAKFRTTPALGGAAVSTSYNSHNLVASLSYVFTPPPPPPPMAAPAAMPAPPPPPSRKVFLVFFDWDRDTITPQGSAILQQAAAAYKSGAPVQIQVTGYTDRSGSPGYNQRLSERRASNVANALAGMGVPRNQMAVSGRGENDNRVPTANGVREPQNRRVEIVMP